MSSWKRSSERTSLCQTKLCAPIQGLPTATCCLEGSLRHPPGARRTHAHGRDAPHLNVKYPLLPTNMSLPSTPHSNCGTAKEGYHWPDFERPYRHQPADSARPFTRGNLNAACIGFKVLHDNGLVHRDLKLQNIMIKRDERGQVQAEWKRGRCFYSTLP